MAERFKAHAWRACIGFTSCGFESHSFRQINSLNQFETKEIKKYNKLIIMKNILITGGAGFIAHHIIAHVIKNTDWNITTVDRLDISGNLNRLDDILKEFSIEDKKRLRIIFHDLKAEINSQIKSEIGEPNIILTLLLR